MSRRKKQNHVSIIAAVIVLVVAVIAIGGIYYSNTQSVKPPNTQTVSCDLYFLDSSTSLMKAEKRDIKGENNADIFANVLSELKAGPKIEGLSKIIPDNVIFESANIDHGLATLNISKEYLEMKSGEELLCRGSIVWTLTGLEFVDSVIITVDGKELTKTNGEPIGRMTREDIVIDGVVSPEVTHYQTVKLYFGNADATGLQIEEREIEVNPNEALEKYIMEELIKGPADSDLIATVPSETKIREIKTTQDGICYVDLSNEFVTRHNGGSTGEILTVYSIVNSLTELNKVKRVQFLIEGEKVEEYKGHLDFSQPFEAREIDI